MVGERIRSVAIRVAGVVHELPPPMRHHHIAHRLSKLGFDPEAYSDQGFVTSTGRFVDRLEGCVIAKAAGQIKRHSRPSHKLFSEDLW